MSWVVESEKCSMLGYELIVSIMNSEFHWQVYPDRLQPKKGAASGFCATREKAMAAAEEAVRCLDRHSP